jgi:hypothetical protein
MERSPPIHAKVEYLPGELLSKQLRERPLRMIFGFCQLTGSTAMAKPPCDIPSLAQAHTEDAIKTLAAITRQVDASPAARVSAATALLDRGWGKSTQPISPDAAPLEDATTDELYALLDTVRSLRAGDDAGAGRGDAGAADPGGPAAP